MRQYLAQKYSMNLTPWDLEAKRTRFYGNTALRGLSGYAIPGMYAQGSAQARSNGYSIPVDAVDAGGGAAVICANPDGTFANVFDWMNYPPTHLYDPNPPIIGQYASNCAGWTGTVPAPGSGPYWTAAQGGIPKCGCGLPGTAGPCTSFKLPPADVWYGALAQIHPEQIAAIQAANLAADQAYAAAAGPIATPGVPPASYTPTPLPPVTVTPPTTINTPPAYNPPVYTPPSYPVTYPPVTYYPPISSPGSPAPVAVSTNPVPLAPAPAASTAFDLGTFLQTPTGMLAAGGAALVVLMALGGKR